MKTIREVMDEMRVASRHGTQLVRDWREMIPWDSRWSPGDPGNPNCKQCAGTGYLRIADLPIGHPLFGKLVLCECAGIQVRTKQLTKDDDYLLPAGRR